ncbi:MAG: Yip1 family protein [Vicinamibacterales bacterium]
MGIVERVKNICVSPNAEWPVIASEPASTGSLISGYAAPLAAIGAVAGLIGGTVVGRSFWFGTGVYRVPLVTGIGIAVFAFAMAIVGAFVLALVINALAPTFGGQKDSTQALKIAVYSFTPAWVAGVLQVLPSLSSLALLGGLYGLYLLYLGLPVLMKAPQDKAVAYTVVTILCTIVITAVLGMVGGAVVGVGAFGSGMLGSGMASSAPASEVTFDANSPLGKLQELGKAMEESGKKMDAAEKAGDTGAQTAAAMEALGTLLGGGRRVDPIAPDQLKPFLPETFAGMPRTNFESEKSGMVGVMVSHAQATYDDGAGRRVRLEISDSGGASGLMGLASWAAVQTSKEDDNGSERTTTVDGRLVHEKMSKSGDDEFSVVLGKRFVVSAKGTGVPLDHLKTGVGDLDLGKLEEMKDVGVQP